MAIGGKKSNSKKINPWFAFVAKVQKEDNIQGGPTAIMAAKKRGPAAYAAFKQSMGKSGGAATQGATVDSQMSEAGTDLTKAADETDYAIGDAERAADTLGAEADSSMGGGRRKKKRSRSTKKRTNKKRKGKKTKKRR